MEKDTEYSTHLPLGDNVYDVECPLLHALRLIGGKWKLPVLWRLADGPVRHNALKRGVVGVTGMMLHKCLKELEADGLVQRVEQDGRIPRVEYSLTEAGRDLLTALNALYAWGARRLAGERERKEAER